ncbi:hypothetical protein J1P26_17370 [Neobacillus sp. MM2021_6]|uniref:hypothetical protein n=1 Tax=Bacillaceae TaxID=186817 RepID=UPI0014073869|nr:MULTISPECIES: hypothetical protein [Bacillaceae]MBO0961479.1 hypothetical protein [Neobacillus sp. MM2021_6]NHC19583.1 hypothetical protein [Bacillus sp. MM2020_4]
MNMEIEIQKIIRDSSTDIAEMVKENIKKDIVNSLTWSVREETSKLVQEFFKNELAGEVKNALENVKPQLQVELEKAVVNIAATAGNQLMENAAKNLSHSWNVQKITEALFK